MKKSFLVRSPIAYTGGKFRLLPQHIIKFPDSIPIFVDLFCGSIVVSLNVYADIYICNDICTPLISIFKYLQIHSFEHILSEIQKRILRFNLSDSNQEGFNALRDEYNALHHPLNLYLLICHSFNNHLRFNTAFDFTATFGKRTFIEDHQRRLEYIVYRFKQEEWNFISKDFLEIDISSWNEQFFVYADPPYSLGHATYNENESWWPKHKDQELLDFLDTLHAKHIKFALANVTHHKGLVNDQLIEWAKKYTVYVMDMDYSNAVYHQKDRTTEGTQEVLIVNYEIPQYESQLTWQELDL